MRTASSRRAISRYTPLLSMTRWVYGRGGECTPEDVHVLAISLRKHVYKKGQTIQFQGVISHQLYLVGAGSVYVSARRNGANRLLAILDRGAFFGENALLNNSAATATVKAVEDGTEVYTIDDDVLREIMGRPRPGAEDGLRERARLRLQALVDREKLEGPGSAEYAGAGAF